MIFYKRMHRKNNNALLFTKEEHSVKENDSFLIVVKNQ